MKKGLALSLVATLLLSTVAHAEINPQRTAYDSRIQTVFYNPDDVTRIKVKEGVSTLIQLDKDEFITEPVAGMGLGDPLAWNVSVRGNSIFLRPIAEQPDTNVTLVSNKRTYAFSLESVSKGVPAAWIVRFVYPVPPKNVFNSKPPLPCMTTGHMNWNYQKKGDSTIAPVGAWDDGRFTCLRFPSSTDLPMVYRILPDGKEGLVNTHMENDVMVIHEVANEYRVRLGNLVLGIKSDSIKPASYSTNATSTGLKREVINETK